MKKYNSAPGRGMMNQTAFDLRMDYLKSLVENIEPSLHSDSLKLPQIQNNIESFIGTIEIPLGLIGPLSFAQENGEVEMVHTAVATTEGALVASMNRGAKAISQCGGFSAHVLHQKMLRAPMFAFSDLYKSLAFNKWILANYERIKRAAQSHSNHAELIEIKNVVVGKVVHLKFIYTTCDASGQNMTTSCTWHACLWIQEEFQKETGVEIVNFVIDGNGSSDKKVSHYSMQNGRGASVTSECHLTNEVIEKTLRTTADDMFDSFNNSMAITRLDGMIGYNINVANAIAGIFGATGQDLACIHESSTAIFQLEKTEDGLYASLSLPTLVVGTVGGGTHLPVAAKILELMGCNGKGKAGRFAQLISGFALSLELSTHAAIASGQFARAHQKLGRNKPVNWLLKSELELSFFKANVKNIPAEIKDVRFVDRADLDNGILTQLATKVCKKTLGFVDTEIHLENGTSLPVLVKSKALGDEVINGLHFLASNLNIELADTLLKHKESLEYGQTHLVEIEMYEALSAIDFRFMPTYYGAKIDLEREIYLFFIERLNSNEMMLFNTENTPELWTEALMKKTIDTIHIVHSHYDHEEAYEALTSVSEFNPIEAIELYRTFIENNRRDYDYLEMSTCFDLMNEILNDWEVNGIHPVGKKTVIHNDFNPRNIGIRANGDPCIYDWELATINIPQRDIFEFLAFTLDPDFELSVLEKLLKYHCDLTKSFNEESYSWEDYLYDFQLAGNEFLVTRVCFYLAGSTLVNYAFIERVFKTSYSILKCSKLVPVG